MVTGKQQKKFTAAYFCCMITTIGTDIRMAAALLKAGELVAIPTETVYGLAANALDESAVVKIYSVKNRPQFNPLILHVSGMEQLEKLQLSLPPGAKLLAEKFSPGPLTFVIPTSHVIPGIVTAGTPAVAIRIPQHRVTLELLRELDFPLAAPSANPSGYVSPTTARHVAEQLEGKIPYILDGGTCSVGLESTIISFLEDKPRLLRFGGLPVEAIEAVVGKVELPETGFVDNPVAPGMLARHYATKHPLLLGDADDLIRESQLHHEGKRIATISLSKSFPSVPSTHQFILSGEGNLEEAARRLFHAMRLADAMDIDLIIAEKFPDSGLGRAINDRLKRASAQD